MTQVANRPSVRVQSGISCIDSKDDIVEKSDFFVQSDEIKVLSFVVVRPWIRLLGSSAYSVWWILSLIISVAYCFIISLLLTHINTILVRVLIRGTFGFISLREEILSLEVKKCVTLSSVSWFSGKTCRFLFFNHSLWLQKARRISALNYFLWAEVIWK